MNKDQYNKLKEGQGFIAALDQSGGSTPRALAGYGINEDQYSNEDEMFNLVHDMRTRIMTSPSFTGDKVIGAILFEQTMDRQVEGKYSADYLWEEKQIVPFLKIDKGLEELENGVQLMKAIPNLDKTLEHAKERGIFGTKERANILEANEEGIKAIVKQQFEIGKQVADAGLVPILEPEININMADKAKAEEILAREILAELDKLPKDSIYMLKITIPENDNQYKAIIDHPNMLQVVALSGGYSLAEANERLAKNEGLLASFSRALINDLSANQTEEEFNQALAEAVDSIYEASIK